MFRTFKNRNNEKAISFAFILFLLLIVNSCSHSIDMSGITQTICFQTQVLPIFVENCTEKGCHTGSTSGGRSRSALTDYASIMKKIIPNDSKNSLAFKRITASGLNQIMPPSPHPPLSSAQIAIIEVWIQQGAINDTICK